MREGLIEELRHYFEDVPLVLEAADELERQDKYNKELVGAASKMHTWIFLHSADEQDAYDWCGLTEEQNALFGYGGKYEMRIAGEINDEKN